MFPNFSIIDNLNMIQVDLFLSIARDNNIILRSDDIYFLKSKIAENGKINYEEVIKGLALIA